MKLCKRLAAERDFVERVLGNKTICDLCEATLHTYAEVCSAGLSDPCPGFKAIEDAKKQFEESEKE